MPDSTGYVSCNVVMDTMNQYHAKLILASKYSNKLVKKKKTLQRNVFTT